MPRGSSESSRLDLSSTAVCAILNETCRMHPEGECINMPESPD